MRVGDHGQSTVSVRRRRRALHQMLTLATRAVSLCDGHTKPAAGLTASTPTSPVPRRTRVSFERARTATSRADQTTVRRANLGVVLQQIAGGEPRSRARVAAETGLTRGTVSSLVGELIELDLLRETGEDERSGRVGRPAQTLELGDRVVAIGLEVNVDYLAVCVEDLSGTSATSGASTPTTGARRPAPCSNRLAPDGERGARRDRGGSSRSRRYRRRASGSRRGADRNAAPRPEPRLVGDPGCRGARRAPARRFAVRVENEANLAALAEHWQGVARDLENFICVFGEVGVGGGIFIDGELFRGAHGFGGEIGHITVDPGRPALRVRRDRLPRDVRRPGGHRPARRHRRRRRRPDPQRHRGARPSRGARRPGRLESLAEAGRDLGIGLALGREPVRRRRRRARRLLRPARAVARGRRDQRLGERVLSAAWSGCEVRASEFGEGAAVRGAAAMTLRSVLAEPWLVARAAGAHAERVS